jgi:hypothetical protein
MSIEMQMAQRKFLANGGVLERALMAKMKSGEIAKEYEYHEYPKMVRLMKGTETVECSTELGNGDRRKTWTETRDIVEEIIVNSEEEEDRVLAGGKTSTQMEEERQQLILRARSLGLKVDMAWSAVRLRREMGDKLDAPAPEDKMARLAAELDQLRKMAAMEDEIAALRARLAPPDPDDMRGQLEALGIKVDGRWSATRLREELDKATAPERAA